MDKRICVTSHDPEVRKGPWTMEEDLILINYIANHGEGVWNFLAKAAGLKRTGKSCRLQWLNYLRPDVRRGKQLLIMELHAKWGNRWSKIAKHLPGRTDNEIKNYWRTRIQKHLKQTENFQQQQQQSNDNSDQINNHHHHNQPCSSSQVFTTMAHPNIETYSHSPPSYDLGMLHINPFSTHQFATNNPDHHSSCCTNDNNNINSNNNYWSMEDIWSMQLD